MILPKTPIKKTAAAAVAAAMVGIGSSANADVLATSVLLLNQLQFTNNATGNILDFNTDFQSLTFTTTTDISAALSGFPTQSFNGGNPPTSPLDPAPVCVGTACPVIVNNTYPILTAPPGGDYSAADSNELGAPIANVPDVGGGVFPTPATVNQAAYTGLDVISGLASSNANQNLNSSFVFSLNNSMQVDINFQATHYLEATVTSDEQFPGFATAASTQGFTITQLGVGGGVVFEWEPDGNGTITGGTVNSDPFDLNQTISLNAPLPIDITQTSNGTPGVASVGNFSATTPVLMAGVLYQLSARSNTNADAQRVPEPGVLALMGFGILGLGALGRRRRRSS